jgi:hypothetical protein
MAVYDDNGPGYDVNSLKGSNVTIVLDKEGIQPYSSPDEVFTGRNGEPGNSGWIDGSVYIAA